MESDNTIIRKDTSQPDKSYVTDDWRKAMLNVETVYADATIVLRVNGVRVGLSVTSSELSKVIKSAYGEVLGHTVGDNAVSKIIQFLRNKRMIVQGDNRKGAPYRFNPDFVW